MLVIEPGGLGGQRAESVICTAAGIIRRRCIVIAAMHKVLKAEYDAATNTLRLAEPAEGLRDHDEVDVTVAKRTQAAPQSLQPFIGCLAGEAGDDFARALDEMFPIER